MTYAKFFLMVKESLASGEEYIVGARFQYLLERAIAFYAQFLVSSVGAYKVDKSRWELVSILLVHPTLYALYNLRILKTVYMVPSSTVISAR